MLKQVGIFAVLTLAGALAAVAPSHAQRNGWPNIENPFQGGQGFPSSQWNVPREENSREDRDVPLSEVLRNLKQRYGGQHLDARKQGNYYIISWITNDGRRLTIRVNAQTGQEG